MENSQALAGVWIGVQALGLPALAFVVTFGFAGRVLRQAAALGLAALVGVLAGWAAIFGPQAAFPPQQTLDWLPWLGGATAAALALVAGRSPAVQRAVGGVLLAAGLWLLSPPLLREAAAAERAAEWAGALALGALLLWAALRRFDGARAAAALAAAFAGLGFVTALGGSIVVGALALAAFAVAGLVWLGQAAGRLPRPGPALAAGGVLWWLFAAFSARHLAEIHLAETLLAAAAAAAAALALDPPRDSRLKRAAAQLLPAAAPAGVAAGLALWRYLSAASMGY